MTRSRAYAVRPLWIERAGVTQYWPGAYARLSRRLRGPTGQTASHAARRDRGRRTAYARERVMVCPPLRCDKDEARSRAARLPDYPRILPPVNGGGAEARDVVSK